MAEVKHRLIENSARVIADNLLIIQKFRREYEKERCSEAFFSTTGKGKTAIINARKRMWKAIEDAEVQKFIDYEMVYNRLIGETGVKVNKNPELERLEQALAYIESAMTEKEKVQLRMETMWVWCKELELAHANDNNIDERSENLKDAEAEIIGVANGIGERIYGQYNETYSSSLDNLNRCVDEFIEGKSNRIKALLEILFISTTTYWPGQQMSAIGLLCIGRVLYNEAIGSGEASTIAEIEEKINERMKHLDGYAKVKLRALLVAADWDFLEKLGNLQGEKFGLAVLISYLKGHDSRIYQVAERFKQQFARQQSHSSLNTQA